MLLNCGLCRLHITFLDEIREEANKLNKLIHTSIIQSLRLYNQTCLAIVSQLQCYLLLNNIRSLCCKSSDNKNDSSLTVLTVFYHYYKHLHFFLYYFVNSLIVLTHAIEHCIIFQLCLFVCSQMWQKYYNYDKETTTRPSKLRSLKLFKLIDI